MKSPQLAFACFITQRLERNGYFDSPAGVREHAFRFHHDDNAEISAAAFSHSSVLLNSQRIPTKHVRAALIVKGIEKNSHVVVAKNLVALGHRRAHLVEFVVVAMKRQIKKL